MVAATPCREVCVGGMDRCVCVGGDGKEFKGNVTRYTQLYSTEIKFRKHLLN